jgi:membrane-bound lytic murein transglycosylase B
MRIGISAGGTPAHAPSWVRPKQWPVLAVVAGVAALGITLAAVPGSPQQHPPARQVAVAADPPLAGVAVAAPIPATTSSAVAAPHTPSPTPALTSADPATIFTLASDGIPVTALDAYKQAAASDPRCHLPWPLLAAIGRVESDDGRFGGSVLYLNGTSSRKIIGVPLNGHGTALVTDTDHGRLDGDKRFDRAVGPMQFIPSTWAVYRADGNHDGKFDPFNIYDAAAAAARYLCAAGGNLSTLRGQVRAVLAYNHSSAYLNTVLQLERSYAKGVGLVVPVGPVPLRRPVVHRLPPPVDPGRPLGMPHRKPHRPAPATASVRSSTSPSAAATPTDTTTSACPSTTASTSSSPSGSSSGSTSASASESPSSPASTSSSLSGTSTATPTPTDTSSTPAC